MPPKIPIDSIVAKYLESKGYKKTLETLHNEAGLGQLQNIDEFEALEDIIHDRYRYLEHSATVDSSGSNFQHLLLSLIKPWKFLKVSEKHEIPNSAMCLGVSEGVLSDDRKVLLVSSNDRRLSVLDVGNGFALISETIPAKSSPIFKAFIALNGTDYVVAGAMDGFVYFFKVEGSNLQPKGRFKVHNRVITKLLHVPGETPNCGYLVTIGFDTSINLVQLDWDESAIQCTQLNRLKLQSNATDIGLSYALVNCARTPIIVLLRLNSSLISVIALDSNSLIEIARISANDAEFSSHAFSSMALSIYESPEISLICIGTSHIPYMRLVTVELPKKFNKKEEPVAVLRGHIVANVSSMSPQDKYSNPLISWKKDGSGVWVAGDDGVIRGINFANNTVLVVKTLKGFETSEVRYKCFCVIGEEQETLVAGTTDKKLFYWE